MQQELRRSQRLIDKQKRLAATAATAATASEKLSLVLPLEQDLKDTVAFHDKNHFVSKRNRKKIYLGSQEIGGPVDFIVYGVLKYEIGDKKANLAKKRTALFLTLTALFIVTRLVLFVTGVIKCQENVN